MQHSRAAAMAAREFFDISRKCGDFSREKSIKLDKPSARDYTDDEMFKSRKMTCSNGTTI